MSTDARLQALLEKRLSRAKAVRRIQRGEGPRRASPAQERMLFLEELHPGAATYHVVFTFRLDGPVDADRLESALRRVERRHEILRTVYERRGAEEFQLVGAPALGLRRAEQDEDLDAQVMAEFARPFDLRRGPVWRALLLRASDTSHHLVLTLHHIAFDASSIDVLLRELVDGYAGLPEPEPLAIQYADFAAWQRERDHRDQLEYWTGQLADAPARLDLPADRAAASAGRAGLVRTHLDAELTAGLHALARRHGATSFMVLLACFQSLLHRYSGQSDVVVGTSVAGRTVPEAEPLIGLFVNTVALRATMDGRTRFADLLGQVRATASEGFSRQDVPFESVVGELPLDRDLAATPVFQVLINWITVDREPLRLGEALMTYVPRAGTGAAKFELTLEAGEDNGRLELELEYDSGRWDEATARRLLGHLTTLVRGAVADPSRPIGELPLMGAEELELVTERWPGWTADYGHPPNLGDLSEVDENAIALVDGTEQVTFGELNRRADRLAHHLVALGAVPDRPIGVLLERSAELVVALLGVLRAGAPCLPLDPDNPDARSAAVLDDAGAALVVTDAVLAPRVTTCATVVMGEVPDGPGGPPDVRTDPDDLAYVFYTSGSTGRPKGVMISHRAAHNQIRWQLDTHGPGPGDAVLFKTTVTFDVSVTELFTALHGGARLIVAEPGGHRDPAYLRRLIAEHGVTRAHFVPTMLAALVAAEGGSLDSLELVESAGEPMPPELRDAFLTATNAKLLNAYGPTETTVLVTAGDTHLGESAVPIGYSIANSPCYVLDENLNPQPIGVPGELCIGGAQLARGYLGRPDRTAEAFVPDPFGGDRLYRSGDRARWLPDGQLECLGRIDHQVKLRGHRIELGEIEAVLAEHDDVDQAVVVVHGDQLAAYLLGAEVEPRVLRDWLAARLPSYMVPASYTQLDKLPQTSSGKVDRGKLPAPTGHAVAVSYVEPATPVEWQLAEIWRDVLGVQRVGREDDFFALGGHSLLAVQMIGRIRETLGTPVPLRMLFETPTIGRLADRIAEVTGPGLPVVEPAGDRTRLSAAEARLWFVDQLSPGDPAYNLPAICRLHGPLDVDALTAGIRTLASTHEALRTAFPATDGRPARALVDTPLPIRRITASSPEEVRAILADEAAFRFDLATGPLARATIITIDASEHVLALVFHHSIVDGSSIGVLLDDLRAAYAGRALPPRRLGAADYAAWQHELDHSGALDYWRSRLAGLPPVPDLPADGPREPGSAGAARHFTVPASLTERLAALAADEGATPFMGLLAGYAALLSRYTGQDDLVLTMPVTDRARPELEGVVGLLLNTVVLRLDTTGTYRELLHRVRDAVLAAYEHRTLPFDRLVGELGLDGPALTSYSVTLDPSVAGTTDFADDVVLQPEPFQPEHTKADLNLLFDEDATGGWLVYRTGLFEPGRIERLAGHLLTLLGGALADPDVPLASLAVLTADERTALTPETPAGPRRTLPELFSAQVARTPDAPAVPGLTYRQLDERANRFAHHLLSQGMGGQLIALSLDRGPDQAVAILGAWRAGCAYLALDPHHPEARRRDLVADSGAQLVVDELVYADCAEPPAVFADPDDLAYLVYTSGSTGRPKGVRTPHGAAAEYLADYLGARFGIGPGDTVLQLASLPFDAAIRDLFGPLTTGARVVLLDHEHAADPEAILEVIDREQVTCLLSVVPTLLRALLGAAGTGHGQHLRLVLTAGEALDLADRARTRATFGGRPLVVNQYGPTEATMTTTAHEITEGTEGPAPLGLPVAGARLWIVDRHGDLAPIGVPGEVWIGGSRLAQGYHHRPDLTAERFVPDPFARVPGARAYRTGDLARWDSDGSLRFLGRLDDQVKIRGNRVEPAGVENVLRGLPGVAEAAVLATGDPVRLAAYVTPATLDGDALREELRGLLPEYQVPSWIQAINSLPRTANNKVDKKALAGREAPASPENVARSVTEAVLASLFDELLGTGRGDDFFARGGHSLLAAQLAARIRRAFGVSLPLRVVLDNPTIAGLAAWLDNQTGTSAVLAGQPAGELSPGQRAILDHTREHPGTAAYHVGFAAMLDGPLDETALVRAVDATVARHEILRTRFGDRPHVEPNVLIRFLRREARDEAEATALAETELRTPFDLVNGPPIRAALIRCGASRHLFALTAHHIAADGWTLAVLQRDLTEYYNAQVTGRIPRLPVVTPYRGAPIEQSDVDYWTARLAAVPTALDLPTDHPRPNSLGDATPVGRSDRATHDSGGGATRTSRDCATRDPLAGATRYFDIEPETTAAIRALAAETGTTEFMVLLAATQRWLHEQTAQDRFRIAVPVSNRPDPETEHNAGPYANLMAIPADLTGRPGFRTLLTRVRDTVLDAWEHQRTPYEALGQPRCQVMFGMQNLPSPADDLTGLTTTPRALDRGTCRYELHLRCYETPDGLAGWLEHSTALFTPEGIEGRLTHFLTTLHRAVTEPEGR